MGLVKHGDYLSKAVATEKEELQHITAVVFAFNCDYIKAQFSWISCLLLKQKL